MSYNPTNPCDDFTDCGNTVSYSDPKSESAAYKHTINNSIGSDATLYQLSIIRTFNIRYGWNRSQAIDRVVSTPYQQISCTSGASAVPSSSIQENCVIRKRVPYYLDRTQGIAVYKETIETLSFNISSSKTATFRQMMGNMVFHKILIPNTVKARGTESFILENNGVRTVLVEKTYEFNPFPPLDPQRIYTLNGGTMEQDNRYGTPTSDVACVIILPPPPSLGIPLDADVAAYGFYDYFGLEEGSGMSHSKLMQDDGGPDFFYPEWCRNMIPDPLWQETRTRRFDLNFPGIGQPRPEVISSAAWNPPPPETYYLPFGSFCKDGLDNFIYSCLLDFSSKSMGGTKIVHYSSFGDIKKAIFSDNTLPSNPNWIITPASPL